MRGLVLKVTLLGSTGVVCGQKACAIDLVGGKQGVEFQASRPDTQHRAIIGMTDAVVRGEIRADFLRVDLGRAGSTVDKKVLRLLSSAEN